MSYVERDHCVLYGTDLVCAICEAPYGEEHDTACDRHYPAITRAGMVARGFDFHHYCDDCGRSFASKNPDARLCPGCDRAHDAEAGDVPS